MASKKRKHPLLPLTMWLGVALVATVMALAWVAGQVGQPIDLDKVFNEGMVTGAGLCTSPKEAQ